jgi:hypothetical protein
MKYHTLLNIAEKSGLEFDDISIAAGNLEQSDLLERDSKCTKTEI